MIMCRAVIGSYESVTRITFLSFHPSCGTLARVHYPIESLVRSQSEFDTDEFWFHPPLAHSICSRLVRRNLRLISDVGIAVSPRILHPFLSILMSLHYP